MSGMQLNTIQCGRLAPTTKCDQAPEVRGSGLDPGHPTGLPVRMNVFHICTGHLWLLSSSNVGSTTKEMELKLLMIILCHTVRPVGFTKRVLNPGSWQ